MNSVRQALLELISLQKQRIAQQDVQLRHQTNELIRWQKQGGDLYEFRLSNLELGEKLTVYGETCILVSRDRSKGRFCIELVNPRNDDEKQEEGT